MCRKQYKGECLVVCDWRVRPVVDMESILQRPHCRFAIHQNLYTTISIFIGKELCLNYSKTRFKLVPSRHITL